MKTYLYTIGNDPYGNTDLHHSEGNGTWFNRAPTMEEALRIIFGGMPFPCETTGRKFFQGGVSLPGVSQWEVIQVWSDEPEAVTTTKKYLHSWGQHNIHVGGKDVGLLAEIYVTDIERYLTPVVALLAAPAADPASTKNTSISPLGGSLLKFSHARHTLQMAAQAQQMSLAQKRWELESLSDGLEEQQKEMKHRLGVLNTYLNGTRHRTQMTHGKRGTGKYAVFQNRMFLSEEVSLLANFKDFDFKNMEALESWLIKTGHIWKMLPFERCILATRIRKDNKDYGDPLANLYNNMANMQNIVWVRDGENVFHVDVEFSFRNAIFPDRDQFDRAFRVCQDYLWKKSFKLSPPANWHGEKLKEGEYDVMGEMRRKPLEEHEPYYSVRNEHAQFKTLEAWQHSEFYTEKLESQMKNAVHDYLKEVNQHQMTFAVLLQGIVDNTEILDVPKGTDLLNWENVDKYFNLIQDYHQVISWKGISDKIATYIDGKVSKGDWLAVCLSEYIPNKHVHTSGKTYRESNPILAKVVETEEVEIRRMGEPNEHYTEKVLKPVIHYFPIRRNHRSGDYYGVRGRVTVPIRLTLASSSYMRMPLPPSLAKNILDDREWKKKNKWAVPLMVNYPKILKAFKVQKFTALSFEAEGND